MNHQLSWNVRSKLDSEYAHSTYGTREAVAYDLSCSCGPVTLGVLTVSERPASNAENYLNHLLEVAIHHLCNYDIALSVQQDTVSLLRRQALDFIRPSMPIISECGIPYVDAYSAHFTNQGAPSMRHHNAPHARTNKTSWHAYRVNAYDVDSGQVYVDGEVVTIQQDPEHPLDLEEEVLNNTLTQVLRAHVYASLNTVSVSVIELV